MRLRIEQTRISDGPGDVVTAVERCMAALEALWLASLDLPEGDDRQRLGYVSWKAGQLIGEERRDALTAQVIEAQR